MTIQLPPLSVQVTQESDISLTDHICKKFGLSSSQIESVQVLKRSIDARKKSNILYIYQIAVDLKDEKSALSSIKGSKKYEAKIPPSTPHINTDKLQAPPVIIGSGPAGLFAALMIDMAGGKSIIVERGKPVEGRMRSVHKFLRKGSFDPESNYCFGEGGAGTFSDGKLTCGRNHPLVKQIFEKFVEFGAPEEILFESHAHIGTDNLIRICQNIRKYLENRGTQFLFECQFLGFKQDDKKTQKTTVQLSTGDIETNHLILAIGHSARDTYHNLFDLGLAMVPKPFALGARFEHPQEVIDQIQYGQCQVLPAAEYKLAAQMGDRGIWTFCMCPGGTLIPTSAQAEHLAINGMSYHARASGFANAAVVVNIRREDFFKGHPLDGLDFQAALERKAFQAGGGQYFSPAQRVEDFISGRTSKGEMKSTYKPGVNSARLDKILPEFVVESIKGALKSYNQKMKGFVCHDALVVGLESKTSAPVCITRDKDFQSVSHPGIYPIGEGAGYAGGIVSAALDGFKVGTSICEKLV